VKKTVACPLHNDRQVGSNHEIYLLEPISRWNLKAVGLASGSLQRLSISLFKKTESKRY